MISMDSQVPRPKKALLLMGCPEVPIQMALVIYLAHRLNQARTETVVAGTGSALSMAKTSDPMGYYLKKLKGINQVIEELAEGRGDYDLCFVFVHNDAGLSYGATVSALSRGQVLLIIFGRNALELESAVEFPAQVISEVAVHNPAELKRKIDEVLLWDA